MQAWDNFGLGVVLAMVVVPVGDPLAIPLVVGLTLTGPVEHIVFHVRMQWHWIFYACLGSCHVHCLQCLVQRGRMCAVLCKR